MVEDFWGPSKKMLNDLKFLDSLRMYDKDNIPGPVIKKIRDKYINHPEFNPSTIKNVSSACEGSTLASVVFQNFFCSFLIALIGFPANHVDQLCNPVFIFFCKGFVECSVFYCAQSVASFYCEVIPYPQQSSGGSGNFPTCRNRPPKDWRAAHNQWPQLYLDKKLVNFKLFIVFQVLNI